jgi:hypothetical protein
VARREGATEATVAIRERVRGAEAGSTGLVDGQPVEVTAIYKSPTVAGMTLVDVRFTDSD